MEEERYSRLTPTERQEEYLRLLNEKNRIKKQMDQRRRTREDVTNQDRERGFVTHFSGANHVEKPRSKPKAVVTIAASAAVPVPVASSGPALGSTAAAATGLGVPLSAVPNSGGVAGDSDSQPVRATNSSEGSRQRKRWAIDRENVGLGGTSAAKAREASVPQPSTGPTSSSTPEDTAASGINGGGDDNDADFEEYGDEEDEYEQDFEFDDFEAGDVREEEDDDGAEAADSADADAGSEMVEDEAEVAHSPSRRSRGDARVRAAEERSSQVLELPASSFFQSVRRSSFDGGAATSSIDSSSAPRHRTEREVIRVGSSHNLTRPTSSSLRTDSFSLDPVDLAAEGNLNMNKKLGDEKSLRRFNSDGGSILSAAGGGRSRLRDVASNSPANELNYDARNLKSTMSLKDAVPAPIGGHRIPSDSPVVVSAQTPVDVELDHSLVQKVAVLDPVQRLKLIDLLVGGGSAAQVAAAAAGVTPRPSDSALASTSEWLGKANQVMPSSGADTASLSVESGSATTSSEMSLSQLPTIAVHVNNLPTYLSRSKDSPTESVGVIDCEQVEASEDPVEAYGDIYNTPREVTAVNNTPTTTVIPLENIRIRILNGWNDRLKRKQVCLQGISVRIAGNQSNELEIKDLDLKIMNGFTTLSRNSEAAVSAKRLFSLQRPVGSVNGDWKGPVEVGAPLELCFSGSVTVDTAALDAAIKSLGLDASAQAIDALELCIRNGSTLPARDADVYVGAKCRWSGTLTDSTLAALNRNGDMNLNVIPLRSEPPRSKSSKGKVADDTTSPIVKSPKRNREGPQLEQSAPNAPVWFASTSKTASASSKNDIFEGLTDYGSPEQLSSESKYPEVSISTGEMGVARVVRRKGDVVFDGPQTDASTTEQSVVPPPAVRRRSGKMVSISSSSDDQAVDKVGSMPVLEKPANSTPGRSKRPPRTRDDDKALRQSLDALEHSDRLSRSRFNNAELEAIEEASRMDTTEGVAVMSNGIVISNKDADTFKARSSAPKIDFSNSETAKLDAQLSSSSSTKSLEQEAQERRLKRRSERIGKVQETVRSALADLAGVMSTLSPSPSTNQLRTRGSGTNLTSDSTNVPEPASNQSSPSADLRDDKNVVPPEGTCTGDVSMSSPIAGISAVMDRETPLDLMDRSLTDIPVLPTGTQLRLEIISTWGDKYYVGLNGIDVFDGEGNIIEYEHAESKVADGGSNIKASETLIENVVGNPSDINVLAEYENDPRHVTNLFDGVNFTRDDLHVWLAPQRDSQVSEEGPSLPHVRSTKDPKKPQKFLNFVTDSARMEWPMAASVSVQFSQETAISMIRVWNYNKSRAHSLRGVKRCRLLLDSRVVFDGEIRIASGSLDSAEANSEVILFTTDLHILSRIAEHDTAAGYHCGMDDNAAEAAAQSWVMRMKEAREAERPRTADTEIAAPPANVSGGAMLGSSVSVGDLRDSLRPSTSVGGAIPPPLISNQLSSSQLMKSMREKGLQDTINKKPATDFDGLSASVSNLLGSLADTSKVLPNQMGKALQPDKVQRVKDSELRSCKSISLMLIDTWGDLDYIGLNGIEVLVGTDLSVLDLDESAVDADPRDLSVLGRFDDPRVPENLLDGINDTTLDEHIWLVPFSSGGQHRVTLSLGEQQRIGGIRLWNYNKSEEDRLRGARLVALFLDDKLCGHFMARIAPGCDGVSFGQEILFRDLDLFSNTSSKFKVTTPPAAYISPAIRQCYETPYLPTGMQWCFSFQSNWGDSYYLGLDAIEFINHKGEVMAVNISNVPASTEKSNNSNSSDRIRCIVSAAPFSVNDLARDSPGNVSMDQRTPFNLFLPAHAASTGSKSAGHTSWLAPVTFSMSDRERQKRGADVLATQRGYRAAMRQKQQQSFSFYTNNVLFVMFEVPVSIAAIRLYNYSKTPTRGVKEFSVSLDGQLVFMGSLSMFAGGNATGPPAACGECSILFTNDAKIVRTEKDRVTFSGDSEQDVLHINDRQVLVRSKYMFQKPAPGTEGIYVDPEQRPGTSMAK